MKIGKRGNVFLRKRELAKLTALKDRNLIKVATGVRRARKSTLHDFQHATLDDVQGIGV